VKADSLLSLLLQGSQLKLVSRTGWAMRGIADAESVSDHSFGVAFIALVLAHVVEQRLDMTKLLTMALLHDLPEAVLSDVPSPALLYFSADAKTTAERDALSAVLAEFPQREQWEIWWQDLEEGASPEAKLVHDADRLDMLLQAYVYEQTTGNRWLEEFWLDVSRASFNCDVSRSLFDALCQARERGARQGSRGES
jgi:putative hydrolase of HD superfamily